MLSDKLYNILKWIAITCLPALVVAIPSLFNTWGWPYGDQIARTLEIIAVLLGSLLGISCATYNQTEEVEEDDNDGNI